MMGLDNPIHLVFLLVVLLLVFGAKRLPEMGRSLGSGLRGFKESIGGEHEQAQLHHDAARVEETAAVSTIAPDPAAEAVTEHTPTRPAA